MLRSYFPVGVGYQDRRIQVRTMTLLHVLGSCLAVFTCAVTVESQQDTWWRVEKYPNPLFQPQACGRHDNIKSGSWICDPNSIITPEDADTIDNLVKQTKSETRCCQSCPNGPTGYVVMVALVPRMYRIVNESDSSRDILYDSKVYSYYLSLYWKIEENCPNKVIILYDKYYNTVFTMTEREARKVLTDEKVIRITLDNWNYFKRGEKNSIAAGLVSVIESYRDVFKGVGKYS